MKSIGLFASATVLMATILFSGAATATSQNWPQSFFNADHTGNNPYESTLATANVSQLQLKWGQNVPSGVVAYALYGGTVYLQTQMAGDGQRHLVALDAATGAVLWDTGTGNDLVGDIYRAIAVTKGFVYAPCGFAGSQTQYPGGGICAYRRANGQQAWSFSDVTDEGLGYLISGPVYSAGTVYLAAIRVYNGNQSDVDDVVALNAKTGAVRWSQQMPSFHSGIDGAPMAVDADHVYVPISCFYPDEPGCPVERYFGGVFALSTTDGAHVWSANLASSSTAFSRGKTALYANTNQRCGYTGGDDMMHETAIDPANGQLLWDVPLSGAAGGCNRSLSPIVGSFVYGAGTDGLHALNTGTGAQKWLAPTYGTPGAGASAANGLVYTWAYNGGGDKISALNA
ncbi:MAG: PQQ-binding-like beta-propeller repeat protein, partial [Sinobacteraceae bacterium]|nr:PQQ-binding-like beta-propeller repeat protein [Nevskiaceae bacterium]